MSVSESVALWAAIVATLTFVFSVFGFFLKMIYDLRKEIHAEFKVQTDYRHKDKSELSAAILHVDGSLGDRIKRLEDFEFNRNRRQGDC